MDSRKLVLAVLAVLSSLTASALLALSSPDAQAEPPRLTSYGNFPDSPSPIGVAVDQPSSDVYVAGLFNFADFSPGHVDKFDASGKRLSPPSPFGEGITSGTAVNPTNGDVYVLREAGFFSPTSIETYDPSTGALLSSFPVEPRSGNFGGLSTIVEIATDSAGNVYVPVVPNNEIQEYSPTGAPLQTFTGAGAGALSGPTGVAVDLSGNVWVADAGNNRIEELGPTGTATGEIESEGVGALTLDTHGDVFAIVNNNADFCGQIAPPCFHLMEYSSVGAQLADIGAGSFGEAGENPRRIPSMPAVADSSGRVYVTDPTKNLVWIFGPPAAPVVGGELSAEVSSSEAKLGALINPGGIETSFRFEYGATSAYGQTTPFPEGNVGQGVTSRTVWAAASGLAPGTTYHYRVIATSELGIVAGADQTFTTETPEQVTCPNEPLRGGFSASLPDCRAYELVTPPTEASTQADGKGSHGGENRAAGDGNRMAYAAIDILPGSQTGGGAYVSTRGASGWTAEDVLPLQSYTGDRCPFINTSTAAYATDLSKGVLRDGGGESLTSPENNIGLGGGCGAEGFEVVSGEPLDVENLLLRDNTSGAYQLINVPPPGVTPANAHFDGASSDLSHVVFDEHAQLTSGAPAGVSDLYEWTGGVVRLVTVLPSGAPAVGSLAALPGHAACAPDLAARACAVAGNGSHIFFTSGGNLYVRLNGEQTVQVDASQAGGSGGGGQFWAASADGSQVFFTDDASAGLTSNTVAGSGANLYRYAGGQLTDLTPGSHAEVEAVPGISEDGSYVYFGARGSLASGATQGQPNLYLYRSGTTTFVVESPSSGAQVSPNGLFLLDGPTILYSAASNRIACPSCNPSTGEPANVDFGRALHFLSNGGRVFFDTAEALLPSDTNGQTDVYEYENGQLRLISTGTSSSESVLLDASENGNDVFFLTRQKLVPQDTEEEARNIYDARVGGGFPAPFSPPACTTADACRSAPAPQPSIFGAPASATFSGAGNLTPSEGNPKPKPKPPTCRKGFVMRKGKCVKKPKKKARRSTHAARKAK